MADMGKKAGKAWYALLLVLLAAGVLLGSLVLWYRHMDAKKGNAFFQAKIRTAYLTGQGTWFARQEKTAWLVTAGHILHGLGAGDRCTVVLENGTEGEAEVIYLSDTADVAFLQVQEQEILEQISIVKQDKQRFDDLQEGDLLYTVVSDGEQSYRVEGKLLYSWIYLEDFSLNMMLAQMPVSMGMSGSAVFDEKGCFVGILCGSSEDGEAAILPLSVISSEWQLVP